MATQASSLPVSSKQPLIAIPFEHKGQLELVSRGELLVAGQRCGQGEKGGEQPGGTLIARGQSAVAGQPGDGALDDPAVSAELLAGLHTAAGDARGDPPLPQPDRRWS
jgi:hypothetical protein